jgi:hypothetical protein
MLFLAKNGTLFMLIMVWVMGFLISKITCLLHSTNLFQTTQGNNLLEKLLPTFISHGYVSYMVWESCLEVNSQRNDNVLAASDKSHLEIIGM